MTTVPPPPPPPPPSQPLKNIHPPPCPQHAAMPFFYNENYPVQETTPSAEAAHDSQGQAAPPPLAVQNGPPPSQGQQDSPDGEDKNKNKPVQETDPEPQTLSSPQILETVQAAVQDEDATSLDQAGDI